MKEEVRPYQEISLEEMRLLASATRKASPAAKAANPALKKVKGK